MHIGVAMFFIIHNHNRLAVLCLQNWSGIHMDMSSYFRIVLEDALWVAFIDTDGFCPVP